MKRKAALVLLSLFIVMGCSNGNKINNPKPDNTQAQANTSSSSNKSTLNNNKETKTIEEPAPKIEPFKGEIVFRNAGWGMTFDQVKASEEMPSIGGSEESEYLEYETSLNGTKANVLYYFHNNTLYSALYLLSPNNNKYINEYTSLKKLLEEKYGKPSVDRKTFNSDLYKDDPSGWETAIAIGELTYVSKWEKGGTEIGIILSGDNFETRLTIVYVSKELSKEADKASKEKTKDNL